MPHGEIKEYFNMASQYVLADHMFVSDIDESSFVSHQYFIAGQADMSIDIPEGGNWGCGIPQSLVNTITKQRTVAALIPACFDYQTLGDELDSAGALVEVLHRLPQRRRLLLERLSGDQAHHLRPRLAERRDLSADGFLQLRPPGQSAVG